MAVGTSAYAYTTCDETENIGPRKFSLLDIVLRSFGVLASGSALCRFIEKGSRVSVTKFKAMWPTLSEQNGCPFSIHEGENIYVGTVSIVVAEVLPTQKVLTPRAEVMCHFDLIRDNMLTVQAWENMLKGKMSDMIVTSAAVPIIMSVLSMQQGCIKCEETEDV